VQLAGVGLDDRDAAVLVRGDLGVGFIGDRRLRQRLLDARGVERAPVRVGPREVLIENSGDGSRIASRGSAHERLVGGRNGRREREEQSQHADESSPKKIPTPRRTLGFGVWDLGFGIF